MSFFALMVGTYVFVLRRVALQKYNLADPTENANDRKKSIR